MRILAGNADLFYIILSAPLMVYQGIPIKKGTAAEAADGQGKPESSQQFEISRIVIRVFRVNLRPKKYCVYRRPD
jgi:hypothetical protein